MGLVVGTDKNSRGVESIELCRFYFTADQKSLAEGGGSQVSVAYFLPPLEVMSMSASALTQQTLKGAAERALEGSKDSKGG